MQIRQLRKAELTLICATLGLTTLGLKDEILQKLYSWLDQKIASARNPMYTPQERQQFLHQLNYCFETVSATFQRQTNNYNSANHQRTLVQQQAQQWYMQRNQQSGNGNGQQQSNVPLKSDHNYHQQNLNNLNGGVGGATGGQTQNPHQIYQHQYQQQLQLLQQHQLLQQQQQQQQHQQQQQQYQHQPQQFLSVPEPPPQELVKTAYGQKVTPKEKEQLEEIMAESKADPFWRVADDVLAEPIALQRHPHEAGRQRLAFQFQLSPGQARRLQRGRGAKGQAAQDQGDPLVLILRCYRFQKDTQHEASRLHCWPLDTALRVNGNFVAVKQRKVSWQGAEKKVSGISELQDITVFCSTQGQNKIEMACTDTERYAVVLQIVKKKTVDEVYDEMTAASIWNEEATKKMIYDSFKVTSLDSDDEGEGEVPPGAKCRWPVRCPLSLLRLSVPARPRRCRHLPCFELRAYLEFASKPGKSQWKCAVCHQPHAPTDLVVDPYFQKVLAALGPDEDLDEVEVWADGQWARPGGKTTGVGGTSEAPGDGGAGQQTPAPKRAAGQARSGSRGVAAAAEMMNEPPSSDEEGEGGDEPLLGVPLEDGVGGAAASLAAMSNRVVDSFLAPELATAAAPVNSNNMTINDVIELLSDSDDEPSAPAPAPAAVPAPASAPALPSAPPNTAASSTTGTENVVEDTSFASQLQESYQSPAQRAGRRRPRVNYAEPSSDLSDLEGGETCAPATKKTKVRHGNQSNARMNGCPEQGSTASAQSDLSNQQLPMNAPAQQTATAVDQAFLAALAAFSRGVQR